MPVVSLLAIVGLLTVVDHDGNVVLLLSIVFLLAVIGLLSIVGLLAIIALLPVIALLSIVALLAIVPLLPVVTLLAIERRSRRASWRILAQTLVVLLRAGRAGPGNQKAEHQEQGRKELSTRQHVRHPF
ncbi:MAG: hypothetical protein HY303_07660 [Candidatus Wallbacteria bacterium]|nr:hypothetical protein [Candidatus Wallbacteria bacterium]